MKFKRLTFGGHKLSVATLKPFLKDFEEQVRALGYEVGDVRFDQVVVTLEPWKNDPDEEGLNKLCNELGSPHLGGILISKSSE